MMCLFNKLIVKYILLLKEREKIENLRSVDFNLEKM